MPYGRKRRYPYRRRFYGRRSGFRGFRRYRPRYSKRRRMGTGYRRRAKTNIVPKVLYTRLRFQQYGNFNSGGSAYFQTTFRANGPQDPLFALGGGACTGFTELSGLYGSHRVLASKIQIWGYSTCQTPFLFFVHIRGPDGAIMTSAADCLNSVLEAGGDYVSRQVVPYTSGNGYPKFSMNMYRSMASVVGPRAKIDNDFAANTTTYPTSQIYWDCGMTALDGTSTAITCNVMVKITYYTKFSQIVVEYS